MRFLFVAFIIVAVISAYADDLGSFKSAAIRYVDAIKTALALSDEADCSETVAKASEYAAAKIAYYNASSSIRSDRSRNEFRQFGQQTAELSISSVC
jgi:hypothetical protein